MHKHEFTNGAIPADFDRDSLYQSTGRIKPKKSRLPCFLFLFVIFLSACCLVSVYILMPMDTNILILGIDHAPHGSFTGRSDTIILMTFDPIEPYLGMLSIPRDLWVTIPGIGETRINTAHFFAESQAAGTGPRLVIDTIRQNFGLDMSYYARLRFDGVENIVDALGGVDLYLPEAMAGYPAGLHHLTGKKALAFARNRAGSDDFFRMLQGQVLIKSFLRELVNPSNLPRLPLVINAIFGSVDTNIPTWQFPRLLFVVLRVGLDGIDSRTIDREMAIPTITSEGASVLLPNWASINLVVDEMFRK